MAQADLNNCDMQLTLVKITYQVNVSYLIFGQKRVNDFAKLAKYELVSVWKSHHITNFCLSSI